MIVNKEVINIYNSFEHANPLFVTVHVTNEYLLLYILQVYKYLYIALFAYISIFSFKRLQFTKLNYILLKLYCFKNFYNCCLLCI